MNETTNIKAQIQSMIDNLRERLDDAEIVDENRYGANTSAKRVRATLLQVKGEAHQLRHAVTAARKAAKAGN